MNQIKKTWLILTTNCNNHCEWCYAESYRHQNIDFDLIGFEKIIDFLKELGCQKIVFVGGEPTLYPYLIEAIKISIKNSFKCSVITNGRKLSNLNYLINFKQFEDKINFIISLEGKKLVHEKITNSLNSFDETIQGIKNCISLGLLTATNTTLCKQNINNIPDLVSLLSNLGINCFSFNYGMPPINHSFRKNTFLELSEINEAIRNIKNTILKDKLLLYITTPLPLCIFESDILKFLIENNSKINTCCHMLNGKGLILDFNGNILPCTHLTNVSYGNIFKIDSKNEFWKLWDGKIENDYRQKLRKYPNIVCDSCSLKNNCTGGCPLLWTYENPKIVRSIS